jgi:hypothetical protein
MKFKFKSRYLSKNDVQANFKLKDEKKMIFQPNENNSLLKKRLKCI